MAAADSWIDPVKWSVPRLFCRSQIWKSSSRDSAYCLRSLLSSWTVNFGLEGVPRLSEILAGNCNYGDIPDKNSNWELRSLHLNLEHIIIIASVLKGCQTVTCEQSVAWLFMSCNGCVADGVWSQMEDSGGRNEVRNSALLPVTQQQQQINLETQKQESGRRMNMREDVTTNHKSNHIR